MIAFVRSNLFKNYDFYEVDDTEFWATYIYFIISLCMEKPISFLAIANYCTISYWLTDGYSVALLY